MLERAMSGAPLRDKRQVHWMQYISYDTSA